MAHAIRFAKSASDWSANELVAYNITVLSMKPYGFFYFGDPSLDGIDPAIFDAPATADGPDIPDSVVDYFHHLRATNMFVRTIVDFARPGRYKMNTGKGDPESQVIAGAIAAFEFNNRKRDKLGLPRLDHMLVPCITMIGTRPTFYLVPVKKELSEAVITGQYPVTPTLVGKCVTAPVHIQSPTLGLEDPEYRKLALQRFISFKYLIEAYRNRNLKDI